MPKSRPPDPSEFRQRIIELGRKGRTPESLAEQFEPTAQTIRNWLAQADRDAGQRLDDLPTTNRLRLTHPCTRDPWDVSDGPSESSQVAKATGARCACDGLRVAAAGQLGSATRRPADATLKCSCDDVGERGPDSARRVAACNGTGRPRRPPPTGRSATEPRADHATTLDRSDANELRRLTA